MTLIAAGQMSSTSSLRTNLKQALSLVDRASSLGAKVLFLPEAADYIARNSAQSIQIARPVAQSVFVTGIQSRLAELRRLGKQLDVVVGVHEPAWGDASGDKGDNSDENNGDSTKALKRVRNLLLYINSAGDIVQKYQKIHLFDVSVPNGPVYKESSSVEPGKEIVPAFKTPAGMLGMAICYDIRFPELAISLRQTGAQILAYPSAFTVKTGSAHWTLLGRSRAIDSQSYVVMAAQSGVHDTSIEDADDGSIVKTGDKGFRVSYGHSMIVDPWGSVIAEASDVLSENDLIVADVDLEKVENVRKNMPLMEHRKL